MTTFDPTPEERVEHLFEMHLEVGLHHGAQLCVYREGERVVDLAGGTTGPDGDDVDSGRRFVLFSCTKAYTAVCVHRLVEEGEPGLDDAVAEYWPGFGGEGKEEVTVRHVLSHQGGFPYGEIDIRPEDWTDWDAVVDAMEEIQLLFEPGSTAGYHPMNYGWVLGELVRRVAGEPIDEYVRDVVFDPLDMEDTYMGLPAGVEDDVATVVGYEEFDRARRPAYAAPFDLEAAAERFNGEDVHRAVMPAANGVGSARDMARFYACMANGGELDGERVLRDNTVERAVATEVEVERDFTLGVPARYALGFQRSGTPVNRYGVTSRGDAFGHGGLGTCMGWALPDGLAFAYVTNGMRETYENTARIAAMSDAVLEAYGPPGS